MLSPFEIESMEMIVGSLLAVVAVGSVVIPLVGTLTYLLTREPASSHIQSAPMVVTGTPVIREKHAAEVPTAVAG